jgi:hypothetical protein
MTAYFKKLFTRFFLLMTFTVRFVLSQFIFFFFQTVHILMFFLFGKLSAPYEFFFSCCALSWLAFTSGPSGRIGRLGARPCSRPWAGPSAPVLAGLLSAAGCLAPRSADLADVCCRVKYSTKKINADPDPFHR